MATALLLLPLVTALVLLAWRSALSGKVSLLAAVAQLAVTLAMMTGGGFVNDGSFQYVVNVPWVPALGLSFYLGVDGLTMLLLLLTNGLVPFIVAQADLRKMAPAVFPLILLMQFGLNGVFMALDGLLFYFFWEVTLLQIYFICAIWGGEHRIRITFKFFIYTFLGSLLMLLALIYLRNYTPDGSFAIESLYAASGTLLPEGAHVWVLIALFVAFAIKMPVFPFHTWQPDTYTAAPTAGTMLLSGIMLKMGIYGLLRWMLPMVPQAIEVAIPVMMVLSITGIVYAAVIAVQQHDIKRVIAYSSISHVGLIAAGALAGNYSGFQGAAVQMLAHGVNVVGLFYAADILEQRLGTRQLSAMGGIARSAPRFAVLFMVILMGSVAVPLTNGFPGEFLLLYGVFQYHLWAAVVAGLTVILCAIYMLRMYQLSMFGPTNDRTANFADINLTETLTLGLLALAVVVMGFYPQWVIDLVEPAGHKLLQLSSYRQ